MGLFTILLLIVAVLAIMGVGWKAFSSAIINGFEKAVSKGQPLLNSFTQQERQFFNNQRIQLNNN
jgi:Tfp pilus assembly protein PilO